MAQPLVASSRHYKPGDIAPVSGIYAVIHKGHRRRHEVLVIRGEEFPPCRTCKLEVVFEAIRTVEHLTHDFDFAGLVLSTLQIRGGRKGPQLLNKRRG
jgi:hypothetical protein